MWLKKLKHKKLQFSLAGIILFVSALIFSVSLGFTMEANSYGTNYYSREGQPNLMYYSNDERVPEIIRNTLPEAVLGTHEGVVLTEPIKKNGTVVTGVLTVYPLTDYRDLPWEILPKVGDTDSFAPKQGEIWLPSVWADLKDIKIGDTITLQGNINLRVSTLINSYIHSNAGMALTNYFINPEDMKNLPELPVSNLTMLYVANDISEAEQLISDKITGSRGLLAVNRDDMILGLIMTPMILGGIGILSSALVFIVAVIVIRFIMRANLTKEYRSIGIYKSQGFSNGTIRGFYLKCYAFIGGISILLGMIMSLPAISAVCGMIMRYVGEYSNSSFTVILSVLSGLLLFCVLILNVFLATKPVRKITPVDALRIGVTSSKAKFKSSWLKNASSPFAMAVNDIGKHKGYSIMIVLILCVSFYLVFFSLSTMLTVNTMDNELDIWLSFPKADVFVTGDFDEELIEYIREHDSVEKLVISEELLLTSITLNDKNNYPIQIISLVFDDFSDLPYTKGRAPAAENEVAINSMLLPHLGLQTGDYISFTLGSKQSTFLITGEYDSMMNNGRTVQIPAASLPANGAQFEPGLLMIFVKSGINPQSLIDEINRDYTGAQADAEYEMAADALRSIKSMVLPITLILIIVFAVFSLLNISNLILQNHSDSRAQYGILKSLGFSTEYIAARSTFKILILSLIAAVMSFTLHVLLSKAFFAALIINVLKPSIPEIMLALAGLLALMILVTLLFCLPLRKITPLELMEE